MRQAPVVLCLLIGVLHLGNSSALAQHGNAPVYDIEKYCEDVSQAAGGSYQIKSYCMDEERDARAQANSMGAVEERVVNYCKEVGEAVGGSYQIYLYCLKEELEAKAGLE